MSASGSRSASYVADFLARLHRRVVLHGQQALQVQVDPNMDLDADDVASLL
ncbi:MAG: hypothetical protein R3185_07510 [Candidatus Thermoplasmatota archaeon]|nr:hypothetical protein [Candidatus Thermoplasmatota archaeon]